MRKHSAVLSGCLFIIAACGESGGIPAGAPTPPVSTAGMPAGGSTAGAGTSGSTGTAGSTTASGGTGGKPSGDSGGSGGAGGATTLPVTALAMLKPFGSASSGSAGSGGSASGGAGSGGSAAAGGGISGMALFTRVNIGVQAKIDIDGCMDGKSYPVHIHEGMSCDSVMTQGGHWGAMMAAAAGSGGSSAGGSSGAAGQSAGTGGSAAGSGGTAGGAAMMMVRGEGIPDIMCKGTTGSTSLTRSTPDARIAWTIGGDTMTDVVGHVVVVHNAAGDRIACGKIVMQ